MLAMLQRGGQEVLLEEQLLEPPERGGARSAWL
jgi:hypothetical protein